MREKNSPRSNGLAAALPKVRVYMEINHVGPWTSGNKSPENEIIRLAGGENIFGDHAEGAFTTTNAEVVRRNPEIILSPIWLDAKVGGIDGITTLVEIMTRPGYSEITAVKNGRVLYFDSALFKQQACAKSWRFVSSRISCIPTPSRIPRAQFHGNWVACGNRSWLRYRAAHVASARMWASVVTRGESRKMSLPSKR